MILNTLKQDGKSLKEAQNNLDKLIQKNSALLTPWYQRWKKWFLD